MNKETSALGTLALPVVAASGETGRKLNCTARPASEKGNGGRRPGAGRKPLPVNALRRPDLKDRRELKRDRPAE